jgi:hypothetical protein
MDPCGSPERHRTDNRAIRKLLQREHVSALIVAMSMSGEIIKLYAAAAKIPLFRICSVGSLGDELYTFTTMPLAEDEASLWVAEAQRRGVKRIAWFTQDFPSIDDHVRASYKMLVDAFESGQDPLSYTRRMTEFRGTAGTIMKVAGTGKFRSAPAVWQITNGRPVLLTR